MLFQRPPLILVEMGDRIIFGGKNSLLGQKEPFLAFLCVLKKRLQQFFGAMEAPNPTTLLKYFI